LVVPRDRKRKEEKRVTASDEMFEFRDDIQKKVACSSVRKKEEGELYQLSGEREKEGEGERCVA